MRFIAGFMIGIVLGAAAVLLTTPQSGSDLQQGVWDRIDEIFDEGRRAYTSRRAELQTHLTELQRG